MAGVAEEMDAKGGALSTAKDLFAGAVGGVAQVLTGIGGGERVAPGYIRDFQRRADKQSQSHWYRETAPRSYSSHTLRPPKGPRQNDELTCVPGQPFDIVKVRLQTGTQYASALDAVKSIYAQEGALAFYKGTLTPLLGIGACVSIQFGAFGFAKRYFESANQRAHPLSSSSPTSTSTATAAALTGNKKDLSYGQYYAAGAFAGVANSVVSGPIEHVRIRLQAQPHGTGRLYSGPLDCVRKLSARAGLLRGLYRGEAVTVLREAQAYGVWFLAFEWMMSADAARNGVARDRIPSWKVALYGGLAGEALWLASYPLDVVKSKMQTAGFGPDARYRSMRDCFAQTYRLEGARGFWKGLAPTLLRAMPVSACTFATVEATMRLIS
ncbi:hypothetical protein DL768_007274 [Monosporascus sp. mg162]|nr:hypothetical protein DL768_007274 [Monosporascus sp. mg162]